MTDSIPRLFNLHDEVGEYVIADCLDDALSWHKRHVVCAASHEEYMRENISNPCEVTPEEMGRFTFAKEDGTTCTFAEEFIRAIQNESIPYYFASSEY